MRSFLVCDFGIAYTRTVLLDVVEGQYRLLYGTRTRSTTMPPDNDVTLGLIRTIEQIQEQTGRRLLGDEGLIRPAQADGSGFDEFLATASSAGRPLRAVLLGVMDDFSLASAQRALTGTYVEQVGTISLTDSQSEEQRVNAIIRAHPDVIFIAGGTNFGNQEAVRDLVRLVELAVKLIPSHIRPIVLYAGNERLIPWVKARLDEHCVVFTADNIRPSADTENLAPAKLKLGQVFNHFLIRQPGGFADVADISSGGITPTAQSTARLVRYLDSLNDDQGAMYLDVGSGSSSLLTSYDDHTTADIRSTLGIGHGVNEVMRLIDWRDVERWLPFPFSRDALEIWVLNKSLSPTSIPGDIRDLFISQAVVREIIRLMVVDATETWQSEGYKDAKFSPIIVGGGFLNVTVPPKLASMLVMDAVQPSGIVDVWLDPYALAPALGSVSFEEPLAVVQVVDNGGFARLGTAFAPTGRIRGTRARMRVKITMPNGNVIEKQISAGDIWFADITPGVWVDIDVRVSRGLNLDGKRRFTGRVQTGNAGLIFDLRGRPLGIPSGRRRRRIMAEWFAAATGVELTDDDLKTLERQAVEVPMREDLADMVGTLMGGGVTDDDFPEYRNLPKAPLDPAFERLLVPEVEVEDLQFDDDDDDDLFGGSPPQNAENDLRKELGLQ